MTPGKTIGTPAPRRRGAAGPDDARIDRLMERAERALLSTRYFEAERLCRRALERARRRRDFGRMARILMPLQEARRQKRQLASDADRRAGVSRRAGASVRAGFHLVRPPLVGTDARDLRERANESGTPVFVLCREPTTKAGLWPIVAAGPTPGRAFPLVIRTRVAPPPRSRGTRRSPRRDAGDITPPAAWFEAAGEALGDAAIASVPRSLHPAWRADDLYAMLDAFPDHEKLHQRLEEACREALIAPHPGRRPRAFGDPCCF